jgi:hypothetical protein
MNAVEVQGDSIVFHLPNPIRHLWVSWQNLGLYYR